MSFNSCSTTHQASQSNLTSQKTTYCMILPFDFEVSEQSIQPFKQALEDFERIEDYDLKVLHFHIVPGNKKAGLASILLKFGEKTSFVVYDLFDGRQERPIDMYSFIFQQDVVTGSYLSECLLSGKRHTSSDLFVFVDETNNWKIEYTGGLPPNVNDSDINLPRLPIMHILDLERAPAQ